MRQGQNDTNNNINGRIPYQYCKRCNKMKNSMFVVWLLLLLLVCVKSQEKEKDDRWNEKMDLWLRGAYLLDDEYVVESSLWKKVGPIRSIRKRIIESTSHHQDCLDDWLCELRGGGGSNRNKYDDDERKLMELGKTLGPDFIASIELNKREHEEDCRMSCESYYCHKDNGQDDGVVGWKNDDSSTEFTSYSFGATPPEDFADDFGFPLDLIKVSKGEPLFSAEEAAEVIDMAEREGVHNNQYQSGKYRLGGDWLTNLPKTRRWFNGRLKRTFFPLLADLFPEIVSSPSVLRAHSVSLLKYNATHPRTDVHIDNGILAITLAMTPQNQYVGGGTFFEHMGHGNIIEMDVGHGTFRPGSVRHGAHPVTDGTRYILGAFLLLEDRVEHVRRLKNRGSHLRKSGDLEKAAQQFQYALAINPHCTTCLKDWAEILLTQKQFTKAEDKIRQVLTLLEHRDSDALFTLGLILSEQGGRDDESIDAYTQSVNLNAEDAELCYNLGIKYGEKGNTQSEMAMYARAVKVDPTFGGAWINWGTTLAEQGNMEDAEVMFLKAMGCPEVSEKATMNLALVLQNLANQYAANGNLPKARETIRRASNHLDTVKSSSKQWTTLRVTCHRLTGSILAALQQYAECEQEFRIATTNFPTIPGVWEMLARVLDIQGKTEDAIQARQTLKNL